MVIEGNVWRLLKDAFERLTRCGNLKQLTRLLASTGLGRYLIDFLGNGLTDEFLEKLKLNVLRDKRVDLH